MNKELSKALYQLAGLKVPRALAFTQAAAPSPREIEATLGLPVVIKPVNEGSSIGVTIARTREELDTGLKAAFGYDYRVLVEEFIAGTEVTGGVLGNDSPQALPLVEIVPSSDYVFFNYEAKYKPGATTEICPARLNLELTQTAQQCALTAHQALGCRGYSRTDMRIRDGEVYVLETNTIPGHDRHQPVPPGGPGHGPGIPGPAGHLD